MGADQAGVVECLAVLQWILDWVFLIIHKPARGDPQMTGRRGAGGLWSLTGVSVGSRVD